MKMPKTAVNNGVSSANPSGSELARKIINKINNEIAVSETKYEANTSVIPKTPQPNTNPNPVIQPYQLPDISLLDSKSSDDYYLKNETSANEKWEILSAFLLSYNINATLVDISISPSITRFTISLRSKTKTYPVILKISYYIALQLGAKDIRIEPPITGTNEIVIEMPNTEFIPVRMYEVITSPNMSPEFNRNHPLQIYFGKDLKGNPVTGRLDTLQNLLIGGTTGSGKSVCMRSIITSLLMQSTPDDVKMIMIDTHKAEFSQYKDIPHLISPIIRNQYRALNVLSEIRGWMNERVGLLVANHVKNIHLYNKKVKNNSTQPFKIEKMPYIVIMINDISDFIISNNKETEQLLYDLTWNGPRVGIHLVIGMLNHDHFIQSSIGNANLPSRISFTVNSQAESTSILNQTGAEQLFGNGDMLYLPFGQKTPKRVQGIFVSDKETKRITDHAQKFGSPIYNKNLY